MGNLGLEAEAGAWASDQASPTGHRLCLGLWATCAWGPRPLTPQALRPKLGPGRPKKYDSTMQMLQFL